MMNKDVVIIGGGISGLSSAFFLKKKGYDVLLCERSSRLGGVTQSVRKEGYLLEEGPNTYMGLTPETMEMVQELGLERELVFPSAVAKKRYIYVDGRLQEIPMNPFTFLSSRLLSAPAKLRLLGEPFVPKIKNGAKKEETIQDFFQRRLGSQVTSRLIDPFVAGVYAGKSDALSAAATFPKLVSLEQQYGSLFKGAVFKRKGQKADRRLYSFKKGLSVLSDALDAWLREDVFKETDFVSFERKSKRQFIIKLKSRQGTEYVVNAKSIIFAVPSPTLAQWLQHLDVELATTLLSIRYAPLMVYHLGYAEEEINHPLDGFGCLIPNSEGLKTLGILWNSSLFDDRAPEGRVLLTVMVGGGRHPEVLKDDPQKLLSDVQYEVSNILGIHEEPVFVNEKRYLKAIPQYELGHRDKTRRIDEFMRSHPGLFITGNFIDGVAGPHCMSRSNRLADQIAVHLSGS